MTGFVTPQSVSDPSTTDGSSPVQRPSKTTSGNSSARSTAVRAVRSIFARSPADSAPMSSAPWRRAPTTSTDAADTRAVTVRGSLWTSTLQRVARSARSCPIAASAPSLNGRSDIRLR